MNRPVHAVAVIRAPGGLDATDSISLGLPPADVPVPVANRHSFDADPDACVDLFHLHCHFDAATEAAARVLLASTERALAAAGIPACHSYVWHEKNGPHIGWSWELWVDSIAALGVGVLHLMRERPRLAGGRLRCMVHCDTDQEYTDHAARMAFIGPPDVLDLHFFKAPDPARCVQACMRSGGDELVVNGILWGGASDSATFRSGCYSSNCLSAAYFFLSASADFATVDGSRCFYAL